MGGFTPAHYAVKFGYDKIVDWREPLFSSPPKFFFTRHAPHKCFSQFWQPGAALVQIICVTWPVFTLPAVYSMDPHTLSAKNNGGNR
jgi:hypothetical protein